MSPFIKKEVRLLLPSWLAVLALALVAPWLSWSDRDTALGGTPLFVFFGMILLTVDSFGREFSLGTFTPLMSQPIDRRQIWRTKITLLVSAAVLIYLAYFISCEFLLQVSQNIADKNISGLMLGQGFQHAAVNAGFALLIALAGGLWTTILLRQIPVAFWITFLAPLGLLVLLTFFLPARWQASNFFPAFLYSLAGIYGVAGFWLAHRLFYRAQDVVWTGGVIAFSRWRYFEARSNHGVTPRRQRPIAALFRKEFQLQSISLFCVGALIVLHAGVIILRAGYGNHFERNSVAESISEFFWVFWLVMPLMIGCMAVAEERKLGVMESQFCLPVSRRVKFFVKFVPALAAGVFLGAVMPLLLEGIAACFHLPDSFLNKDNFLATNYLSGMDVFLISLFLGATGLVLTGFLASTLAKNFMQALSTAIVILVAFAFFHAFLIAGRHLDAGQLIGAGTNLWGAVLPALIGILTILLLVPWLSYRNFNHFAETGRLWRHNIFGVIGALVFVFASSALIYHRVWEKFEPVEPSHGLPKFFLANPPAIQISDAAVQIRLPDGRLWYDGFEDDDFYDQKGWRQLWYDYVRPLPKSIGPQQFFAGSNWVSSVPAWRIDDPEGRPAGYLDTIGIQSNGTLWISSEAKPPAWSGGEMIQFGDETDWQQAGHLGVNNFVLLKKDGTLWQWGTNRFNWNAARTNPPTVRYSAPQRIGTNSDWEKLLSVAFYSSFAQKTDGTLWHVSREDKTDNTQLVEQTNLLDQVTTDHFSWWGSERIAYVSTNGTLWVCNQRRKQSGKEWGDWSGSGFLQVGRDANWANVTVSGEQLVALKTDGSLWRWEFPEHNNGDLATMPPTRVGSHSDWVALNGFWSGTVALAADGGVWFWPASHYFDGAMLKATERPKLLANIFSVNN